MKDFLVSIKKRAVFVLIFLCFAQKCFAASLAAVALNVDGQNVSYGAPPVRIIINGEELTDLPVPPLVFDGYTFVSARECAEKMDASIVWNGLTNEITISAGPAVIALKVGDRTAHVNGEAVVMDAAPKIVNDKTMVPVRFIADKLNYLIIWDDKTRTIHLDKISYAKAPSETPDEAAPAVSVVKPAREIAPEEIPAQEAPETVISALAVSNDNPPLFIITALSPMAKIEKKLLNDNRMYIDIYGATLDVSQFIFKFPENSAVSFARAAQNQVQPEKIVRIVFYLKEGAEYFVNLSPDRSRVVVGFSENVSLPPSPSYIKNIYYDFAENRLVLEKAPGFSAKLTEFEHADDYLNRAYKITVPAGLEEQAGKTVGADGAFLHSVHVFADGARTQLYFYETDIWAFELTEDADHVYIRPVPPKERYKKIVVIDPGHGGNAPGTSGYGLVEKDINLDISLRLYDLIKRSDPDLGVYMTRTTDVDPSFNDRVNLGTLYGDLFVSVHNNYAEFRGGGTNSAANGTETYFFARSDENGADLTSERAAEIMQYKLVEALGSADRGVKTDNYYVLTTAKIPAVLCEIGFLSNQGDAALLATGEYLDKVAFGLYSGIEAIFGVYKPKRPPFAL